MIVLNILGYFGQNKQNSYAALNLIIFFLMRRWSPGDFSENWLISHGMTQFMESYMKYFQFIYFFNKLNR